VNWSLRLALALLFKNQHLHSRLNEKKRKETERNAHDWERYDVWIDIFDISQKFISFLNKIYVIRKNTIKNIVW